MDLNMNLLYDAFNLYYKKAQEAYKAGNNAAAKRNFLLAAETMYKLAKISDGEVKKARVLRAKRLTEIAERVGDGKSIEASAGAKKTSGAAKASGSADSDESKEWTAAEVPKIRFEDIAGLDDVKKAITIRMIYPVLHPDKYATYNKKTGGGVILYGPPGTGKTMIAKAIAAEVDAKFYPVKCSDIVSKWVGDSEKNINALFETARKDERAIIFFDELDGLFAARGADMHNDKRVGEFLQQIDGFSGRSPNLLLLGATNRPWDVDEAARRPGRFSQMIYVPLPDADARRFMIKKSLKGVPVADNVDLDEIVERTDGYSGADIEELCDRAKDAPLLASIEAGEIVSVTFSDLLSALKEVRPSVDQKALTKFEEFN